MTTATKSIDLPEVSETIGSKRLSFASGDKLLELLGIRTGSLSLLGLCVITNRQAHPVSLLECARDIGDPQHAQIGKPASTLLK